MIRKPLHLSGNLLICLCSLFLIGAGISRYLETDSGNILIHNIEVESYEGFLYGGRLFRPIQANSMNQRPSILLLPGNLGDRYSGDHIAMEFARRGFVVLTIEDFGQGSTAPEPDFPTENMADAGYTFLTTRTFTDHERTGLITLYSGSEKALEGKHFPDFTSVLFISPGFSSSEELPDHIRIFTAEYGSDSDHRPENTDAANLRVFSTVHEGMVTDQAVITAALEQFHSDLAIPNDAPLWIGASAQRAIILTALRVLSLLLLMTVCIGISALISGREDRKLLRILSGAAVPVILFLAVNEVMNFFLVSVRLGLPYRYLPEFRQILKTFSPLPFIIMIALCMICSFPIGRSGRLFITDLIAVTGIILCVFGSIPLLRGGKSVWEMTGLSRHRFLIGSAVLFSCLFSVYIRVPGRVKTARLCCGLVCGIIFYLIYSAQPALAFI